MSIGLRSIQYTIYIYIYSVIQCPRNRGRQLFAYIMADKLPILKITTSAIFCNIALVLSFLMAPCFVCDAQFFQRISSRIQSIFIFRKSEGLQILSKFFSECQKVNSQYFHLIFEVVNPHQVNFLMTNIFHKKSVVC